MYKMFFRSIIKTVVALMLLVPSFATLRGLKDHQCCYQGDCVSVDEWLEGDDMTCECSYDSYKDKYVWKNCWKPTTYDTHTTSTPYKKHTTAPMCDCYCWIEDEKYSSGEYSHVSWKNKTCECVSGEWDNCT